MNVQDANLENILAVYFEGTRAAAVVVYLRQEIEHRHGGQLAELLRDHRERAIDSPLEIELRASLDDLMLCCDVLEIAALAGFVPPPGRADFWKSLDIVLENRQVRQYYATIYPVKLPQLLRYRIRARHTRVQDDAPAVANAVIQFLALDHRFVATLNHGCLLPMLDSFRIEGVWFSNIVDIIAQPEEFIRRILLPPEKRAVPDEALHELGLFMQFSFDLDQLLRQLAGYPLLQSEIWNHYGYWFGIVGERLKGQLGDALNQFERWQAAGHDPAAAREIQAYVAQARQVLGVLTSPTHSVPVDELLEEVSEPT